MRNMTITESVTLVTETCIACGVLFAITTDYRTELLQNHHNFYCPNGHPQHFTAKSDAEKLREAEAALEQERRTSANRYEDLRIERASHSATRGHLTRAKKQVARIEKGVCPHCHRSFANVARHMNSKHPHPEPEPVTDS